jgi:hypothetical protein
MNRPFTHTEFMCMAMPSFRVVHSCTDTSI